ncbi:MAG: MerR family transcriptional regulator [Thermoleophilaceae bacterium]
MNEEPTLTIGEVAREAGVRSSAIRYYERVGVLPTPARCGGQRRYSPETIRMLRVIDVAKRAGFSLDDAKLLLSTAGGTPAYEQLRELSLRKLPEVEELIERAQAMRQWLTTASGCNCETLDVCALFAEDAEGDRPSDAPLTLAYVEGC